MSELEYLIDEMIEHLEGDIQNLRNLDVIKRYNKMITLQWQLKQQVQLISAPSPPPSQTPKSEYATFVEKCLDEHDIHDAAVMVRKRIPSPPPQAPPQPPVVPKIPLLKLSDDAVIARITDLYEKGKTPLEIKKELDDNGILYKNGKHISIQRICGIKSMVKHATLSNLDKKIIEKNIKEKQEMVASLEKARKNNAGMSYYDDMGASAFGTIPSPAPAFISEPMPKGRIRKNKSGLPLGSVVGTCKNPFVYENPAKEISMLKKFQINDVIKILDKYYPRNVRGTLFNYGKKYIYELQKLGMIRRLSTQKNERLYPGGMTKTEFEKRVRAEWNNILGKVVGSYGTLQIRKKRVDEIMSLPDGFGIKDVRKEFNKHRNSGGILIRKQGKLELGTVRNYICWAIREGRVEETTGARSLKDKRYRVVKVKVTPNYLTAPNDPKYLETLEAYRESRK